jgi:hypothetical protein
MELTVRFCGHNCGKLSFLQSKKASLDSFKCPLGVGTRLHLLHQSQPNMIEDCSSSHPALH